MKRYSHSIFLFLLIAGLLSISCNAAAILATPTPTVTPSPTATNTPIPTPTSTPFPTGIQINELPDGSTEFVDFDGGYKLTVPNGWTPIPLDEETIDDILSTATEQNAQYETIFNLLEGIDKSIYRIFFFDFRSQNTDGLFVSNINALYQEDELIASMPLDFIVTSTGENLTNILPGAEVQSTDIITLKSGIQVGEIVIKQSIAVADGTKVPAYQKIIIILTEKGMVNITFTVPLDQLDTLQPEMDQVIDSIVLLNP